MARKKHHEEHENHERWLVSYADFITLLFAFFVVMYSISSVNEGKYRVLSDSITQAFRNFPINASGEKVDVTANGQNNPMQAWLMKKRAAKLEEQQRKRKERFKKMADALHQALAPLEQQGQVNINQGAFGISIDIAAGALFQPGEAVLDEQAQQLLSAVGQVLTYTDLPVMVEGHTDNVPISNTRFASNWELSAVRSSAVVRLFVENGVLSSRLTAAGYADQRPVADNDTVEGRSRNRRVRIYIEAPNVTDGEGKDLAAPVTQPAPEHQGQFNGSFPRQ